MSDEENKSQTESESEQTPKKPSPLEWAMAALGVLLIFSVLGFIIYRGVTKDSNPPAFNFEITSVKPSGESFLVTFKIRNTGDETAAEVSVEGELKKGDEAVQTATATVAYVPSHSSREGGLIFTENPQNFSLQLNAKGYEKP